MPPTTRNFYNKSYETDFRNAIDKIDNAVQRGFSGSPGYEEVGVLMMHWENNDVPGIDPAKDRLAAVFRDVYHYDVEPCTIRLNSVGGGPDRFLEKTILDFRDKYEGPKSLLIYYYIGHAGVSSWTGQTLTTWAGTSQEEAPRIEWSGGHSLRAIADRGFGDTLYLLDCCHAADPTYDADGSEHLVASTGEDPATALTFPSFTNRLTELLERGSGAPANIVQIHAELVSQMRSAGTHIKYTPVHIGAKSKPSIYLQRLDTRGVKALQTYQTSGAGKVLVLLSLQGQANIPDVSEFHRWLTHNLPPNLASAEVEAVFHSSSHLILFTLPLEVWDCLEETGVFEFIDFVDSHNLLLPEKNPSKPGTALPVRQKENVPFESSSSPRK
ncbi:MAG: hypothetical protein Q9190_000797 [Brigantiaea leucoxantha]